MRLRRETWAERQAAEADGRVAAFLMNVVWGVVTLALCTAMAVMLMSAAADEAAADDGVDAGCDCVCEPATIRLQVISDKIAPEVLAAVSVKVAAGFYTPGTFVDPAGFEVYPGSTVTLKVLTGTPTSLLLRQVIYLLRRAVGGK